MLRNHRAIQAGIWARALAVTSSGKYLYAAARGWDGGYNGLACHAIDGASGKLSLLEYIETEPVPTGVVLDRDGKFLFITCQPGARLLMYRIDSESGRLTLVEGHDIGKNPLWVVATP